MLFDYYCFKNVKKKTKNAKKIGKKGQQWPKLYFRTVPDKSFKRVPSVLALNYLVFVINMPLFYKKAGLIYSWWYKPDINCLLSHIGHRFRSIFYLIWSYLEFERTTGPLKTTPLISNEKRRTKNKCSRECYKITVNIYINQRIKKF